jgi:hypothetical protein
MATSDLSRFTRAAFEEAIKALTASVIEHFEGISVTEDAVNVVLRETVEASPWCIWTQQACATLAYTRHLEALDLDWLGWSSKAGSNADLLTHMAREALIAEVHALLRPWLHLQGIA